MKNRRIVYDVSTLLVWDRPPVGIVRTQLELAKWLLKHKLSVSNLFVAFDRRRENLTVIPAERVAVLLERLESVSQSPAPTLLTRLSRVNVAAKRRILNFIPARIKSQAQRLITIYNREGMLGAMQHLLAKCLMRLKINLTGGSRFLNRKSREQFSVEIPLMIENALHKVDFLTKDDVYVSVGLDWDHSNYEYLYWAKKSRHFEFVGIFYDAIPIQYPQHVRSTHFPPMFFRHYYLLSHVADRVACISNYSEDAFRAVSTKYQIGRLPDLKTIYLGEKTLSKNKSHRKLPNGFVLYVSTIESRKNHLMLLKCWQRGLKEGRKLPDLVFVGMWGWGIEDLEHYLDENPALLERVHILNDVDDEELAAIYRAARLSVFPSFVEGWGLGAAESLAYGTPCLISDAAALREATRNLMPAIAPDDEIAWLDAIDYYTNDDNSYQDLKKRIESQFETKSWEAFSEEFFVYAMGGERS